MYQMILEENNLAKEELLKELLKDDDFPSNSSTADEGTEPDMMPSEHHEGQDEMHNTNVPVTAAEYKSATADDGSGGDLGNGPSET